MDSANENLIGATNSGSSNVNQQQAHQHYQHKQRFSQQQLAGQADTGAGGSGAPICCQQQQQQQSSYIGSPSTGLVLRGDSQRRESFLYRASENDYEISPKSISRHSSIGSEW